MYVGLISKWENLKWEKEHITEGDGVFLGSLYENSMLYQARKRMEKWLFILKKNILTWCSRNCFIKETKPTKQCCWSFLDWLVASHYLIWQKQLHEFYGNFQIFNANNIYLQECFLCLWLKTISKKPVKTWNSNSALLSYEFKSSVLFCQKRAD